MAREAGDRLRAAMARLQVGSPQFPSLIGASAAVISVVAAYLYFTGWVFAYFYYKDFGVSLLSLDMPLQYFFTYSYTVLDTGRGVTLVVLLLGAIYMYAAKRLSSAGMIGLLVAAFPLLFLAARSVSHLESVRTRVAADFPVRLLFKNPEHARSTRSADPAASASPPLPELIDLSKDEKLHLLLETKDRLIVFYQPSPIADSISAAYVYSLMRSDLEWSMVVVQ